MCGACDGHPGHVFENEGLTPTNERHCVNSVSVVYIAGEPETPLEEEKVSNGEGGGGFSSLLRPVLLLFLAYTFIEKLFAFFAERQMLGS